MIITTKYKRINDYKYIPVKRLSFDLLDYIFISISILILAGGLIN